jgi:hypothetical protein
LLISAVLIIGGALFASSTKTKTSR